MSTETPEQRFARRLGQANAILLLFAADTRIEPRADRIIIKREAPRGDDPTRTFRRQVIVNPEKIKRLPQFIQSRLFYGRTYSYALAGLVQWVWDAERPTLEWWERSTRPDIALGRNNGDALLACLRETDYASGP